MFFRCITLLTYQVFNCKFYKVILKTLKLFVLCFKRNILRLFEIIHDQKALIGCKNYTNHIVLIRIYHCLFKPRKPNYEMNFLKWNCKNLHKLVKNNFKLKTKLMAKMNFLISVFDWSYNIVLQQLFCRVIESLKNCLETPKKLKCKVKSILTST